MLVELQINLYIVLIGIVLGLLYNYLTQPLPRVYEFHEKKNENNLCYNCSYNCNIDDD